MRRILVLFCLFALIVPAAARAYTEIPPFSATEFARQQGVFRWYRGCWWRTVDPNVYLLCNDDGTIYAVLPDGTLRQILREDVERLGLDDSGAGYFQPIHTGYDARGEGIDLPYGATAYERYRTLPISYQIRRTGTETRRGSTSSRRYATTPFGTNGVANNGVSRFLGGGNAGGSNGISGTGVFRSDGTSGGGFVSVGTAGGGTAVGGNTNTTSTTGSTRIQDILSRGGSSSSRSGSGRIQEILARGNSSSSRSTSGRIQEILSRGNGSSTSDTGRKLHIACSGPDDVRDGGTLGPIPCTWFPGVFGPVPDYWGED